MSATGWRERLFFRQSHFSVSDEPSTALVPLFSTGLSRGSVNQPAVSFVMPRHCLLGFLFLLLISSRVPAETLTGRIVGISDGDTLTLLDAKRVQHKIRVAGIDAPEKKQPFGEKAKSSLSALTYNRSAEADCRKIDRYRRNVCVVFVGGMDVGLEQIKAGMAWWYQQYARDQTKRERIDYEHAESLAKLRRFGLWNNANPTPPWEWRHDRRQR